MEDIQENIIINKEIKPPFFRRIFSYAIDYTLLYIILSILAFIFFKNLLPLGFYNIFIGICVGIFYFGIFNSKIFKGQTLGKKICKIVVVDKNNQYLSVSKSILRTIFIIPMLITISNFNSLISTNFYLLIINCIKNSFILINLFLFIINTPQRRLIHDYITSSYVIRKDYSVMQDNESKKNKIFISIICATIISIILSLFSYNGNIHNKSRIPIQTNNLLNEKLDCNIILYNDLNALKDSNKNLNIDVDIFQYIIYDKNFTEKNIAEKRIDEIYQILKSENVDIANAKVVYISIYNGISLGIGGYHLQKYQMFEKGNKIYSH